MEHEFGAAERFAYGSAYLWHPTEDRLLPQPVHNMWEQLDRQLVQDGLSTDVLSR